MDQEHLKRQLDLLWERVQGSTKPEGNLSKNPADMGSVFESVQQELQAEAMNLLKSRFEKEKLYWENLVKAKDDALAHLLKELEEERSRVQELKNRVADLQSVQTQLLQQTYGALEIQKRSLTLRVDQVTEEMDRARQEATALQMLLKEERESKRALALDWEDKEKLWLAELDARQGKINEVQKELHERHQRFLEDQVRLEETVKGLEQQMVDQQGIFDAEKAAMDKILQERQEQAAQMNQSLEAMKAELEKERQERQSAALERERLTAKEEEQSKQFAEELIRRQEKIKDLEFALEELNAQKDGLRKREEHLLSQEEVLRRRREEWVESIRTQTHQQLHISGKIVDMINKIEQGGSSLQIKPAVKPPTIPTFQGRPQAAVQDAHPAAPPSRWNIFARIRINKGLLLTVGGLTLFSVAAFLLVFEGRGVRSIRAQRYLQEGNDYFTRGKLPESYQSLAKAYELDPRNAIIKNSLTLVLGELAHRAFNEGRYDDALKQAEQLNALVPEDPDVLQLHTQILQAISRRDGLAPQAPAAPAVTESSVVPAVETPISPSAIKEPLISPDAVTPPAPPVPSAPPAQEDVAPVDGNAPAVPPAQ